MITAEEALNKTKIAKENSDKEIENDEMFKKTIIEIESLILSNCEKCMSSASIEIYYSDSQTSFLKNSDGLLKSITLKESHGRHLKKFFKKLGYNGSFGYGGMYRGEKMFNLYILWDEWITNPDPLGWDQ